MTDRELLELAAKAAGIEISELVDGEPMKREGDAYWMWNPLTADGDALRLAVKLGLDVVFYPHCACVGRSINQYSDENYENDPYAATRRAIVRAAAEIGKEMK